MASGKTLRSYRLSDQSKLHLHYAASEGPAQGLNTLLEALLLSGVDPDLLVPQGATNPLALDPTDSPVSEWLLRAHECLYGRPNPNSPFAPTGFVPDYLGWYTNAEYLLEALQNLGVKGSTLTPMFEQFRFRRQLDVMRGLVTVEPDPDMFPRVTWVLNRLTPVSDGYVYQEDAW